MTNEERLAENQRISDLIRAQTLRNLEDTARLNSGWRSWMPPAGIALFLWACGALTGSVITWAILTR